ncbi:response regulator transcription factor [Patescibacteria group bacterium]
MDIPLNNGKDKSILFIEDNQEYAKIVSDYLERKQFQLTYVDSAKKALNTLKNNGVYNIIVLDLGLPDIDGLVLCKKIRKNCKFPILVLTARDEISDKLTAFNEGADDYLVKPVSLKELVVRINRLTKRNLREVYRTSILSIGDIKFDSIKGIVTSGETLCKLTQKEKSVFEYFLLNEGRVLTRMEIMDHVWGNNIDEFSNIVSVTVSTLRKKIKKLTSKHIIQSVHGLGYKLSSDW